MSIETDTIFSNAIFVLAGETTLNESELQRALKIGKAVGLSPLQVLQQLQHAKEPSAKAIPSRKSNEALAHILKGLFNSGPISKEMFPRLFALRQTLQVSSERFENIVNCVALGEDLPEYNDDNTTGLRPEKSTALATSYSVPTSGYTVEFAETKSDSYHKALSRAKKLGEVRCFKRDGRSWNVISVPHDRFQEFMSFADSAMGLKLSTLFVDGKEVEWNEVFRFKSCASTRRRAFRKVEYCFGKGDHYLNPWGCRWSGMFWHKGGAEWMQFGKWLAGEKHPTWRFDKEQIREQLLGRIYQVRFCPHLNLMYIDAFLRLLPEQVEVLQGGDWDYQITDDSDPDGLHIEHTMMMGKKKYTTDLIVKGVRPTSQHLLISLVEQAAKEAGMTPPQVAGVIRPADLPKLNPFELKTLPETTGRISVADLRSASGDKAE